MRTLPGRAEACMRAATLTVSPIAVYSEAGSVPTMPTTTGPVLMPTLTRSLSASEMWLLAPCVAASTWFVLVGGWGPEEGEDSIAHEAGNVAAVALDGPVHALESLAHEG